MKAWAALGLSHLCFYCGRRMTEFGPASKSTEHVLPKHLYPKLPMNTVGACLACNGARGGFSLNEFRTWFGEDFFAEKLLHCRIPEPSDVLLRSLYRLVDLAFENQMERIQTVMDSKKLSRRLRAIIKEARGVGL
jgi:hypothetical protein